MTVRELMDFLLDHGALEATVYARNGHCCGRHPGIGTPGFTEDAAWPARVVRLDNGGILIESVDLDLPWWWGIPGRVTWDDIVETGRISVGSQEGQVKEVKVDK